MIRGGSAVKKKSLPELSYILLDKSKFPFFCQGMHKKSGQVGMLPANYVELVI